MHEGLLVLRSGAHALLGVRKDNDWQRLLVLPEGGDGAVGNVYRGRVVRIVPGMQAAFVDIGLSRTAFLHLDDAPVRLRTGDAVLVQVRKEPLGDKGARITAQPSFAGRYTVFVPHARHVAISQQIAQPERRATLMALLRPYLATHGGIVVRTAAAGAEASQLTAELDAHLLRYRQLQAAFAAQKKPGLLSVERSQLVARCRSAFVGTQGELWCNDVQFGEMLADALAEENVAVTTRLGPDVHRGNKQADRLGYFAALQKALRRHVPLANGGSLVIDECEALTVIDVNSGSYVGDGQASVEASVLAVNLDAARRIAHEVRLRGIGGIVVVDFIDVASPESRRQVSAALRAALAEEGGRNYVSPMGELGLVTFTRRRSTPSLRRQTTAPCPTCSGRGQVRAPWQLATLTLDAVGQALRHEPAELMLLHVAPAVADALQGACATDLAATEARYACQLLVVPRAHFVPEQVELLHGNRPGSVQALELSF